MIKSTIVISYSAVCLMLSLPALAQSGHASQELLRQLQASDWSQRASAFESLQRRPGTFADKQNAGALMALLQHEDRVVASTLRESHGKIAVADKYGEEYGEYYTALSEACFRYCDKKAFLELIFQEERSDVSEVRNDAIRTLGQLARPDQGFTTEQRALMTAKLAEDARDRTSFLIREAAVRSIATVVHSDRALLPHHDQIHTAITAATGDTYLAVRQAAVQALGDFGDATDVPLLRRIAERDTGRVISRGTTIHPVRDEAVRSIAKIAPRE
jgi:HEAT repeat protein